MIFPPARLPLPLPLWRRAVSCLAVLVALLVCSCSKSEAPAAAASPANSPKVAVTKEDQLIAQARAALGAEDKLLAVQSLKMTGKIFDGKNQVVGVIQFLFKKPARQRSDFRSTTQGSVIEASNGLEGWMVTSDKPGDLKFNIIKPPMETQNIYTAMENLYFYRATELVRGSEIASEGPVTYRNSTCWKVSFHYPDSITYLRYFDKTTGDLRGTVLMPNGAEFVEEGKKTVAGIAFPSALHNYAPDGTLTQTVQFDSIEVNAPIDDRAFEMPSLITLREAAAASKAAATSAPSQPPVTSQPAASTALPASQPAAARPAVTTKPSASTSSSTTVSPPAAASPYKFPELPSGSN